MVDGELELELEAAGFRLVPPNPRVHRPKPEGPPPKKPEVQPEKPRRQPPNHMVEPPKPEGHPPRLEPQAQEYVGPWRRVDDSEDDVPHEDEPFIEESDSETDEGKINGLDLRAEEHQVEVIRLRRKSREHKRKSKDSDSESDVSV